MTHYTTLVKLAVILLIYISILSPARTALADFTPFGAMDWFDSRSLFVQSIDTDRATPQITSLGAFGVGNGFAFALQGLEYPQNKLTNLVGPIYEKDEELQFFNVWAELSSGPSNAQIKLPKSTLSRISGSNIVICEESNPEITLTSVTYAPPGVVGIFRVFEIRNNTKNSIDGLSLDIKSELRGEKAGTFGKGKIGQLIKGRKMLIGSFGAGAAAEPGMLRISIPPIKPGQAGAAAIYIMFAWEKDPDPAPSVEPTWHEPMPLVEETRKDWKKWLAGTFVVDTPDTKLRDLFESTLVLLRTQMSADSGVIAPMGKYSGFWCRDNFGPVRLLLAAGKYDDVRRSLEYFDYATRVSGFRNRYPLDVKVDPIPPEPDWDKLTPQQGDDPDLLILQYYWYYRATGDKEFIRKHYGFLRRNLTGQHHTDFRLPFNGDETYQVYIMMSESAPMKDFFTPASGFFYTAAAEALSEMAAAIGEAADAKDFAARAEECRKKTEEYYWDDANGRYIPYVKKDTLAAPSSPFADVNLAPLWIGYDTPASEKQRKNALNTAAKLNNSRNTLKSSARCMLYTGMAPGMMLYNMTAVGDLDAASASYRGLMSRVISNTGEFAEGYDGRDRWINYGSAPTVYRPWESAINAEAVLYYITGLRHDPKTGVVTLQPHLPEGVYNFRIENLRAGDAVLTIFINPDESIGGLPTLDPALHIKNTGGKEVSLELLFESDPGRKNLPAFLETFTSPEYKRPLWRVKTTLKPGESKLFR